MNAKPTIDNCFEKSLDKQTRERVLSLFFDLKQAEETNAIVVRQAIESTLTDAPEKTITCVSDFLIDALKSSKKLTNTMSGDGIVVTTKAQRATVLPGASPS